ncbi:MAG: 2Fe-2S iron-sulfur cluster binding domain-containing protein [Gammaproteobacteria bacterium]|nr:2Fe-2S iron-sulfur cluster binding domain-containing protein [Gammaproteobacteria bacterium]
MFGWFSKKEFKLVVDGSPALDLQHKETVLNGALRHKLDFPYSCKVGGCAACKCQLVSGKVKELTDKSYLLSKEEIQQNFILGCQSIPVSDVEIKLPVNPLAQQRTQGTIVKQVALTHDISEVFIELDTAVQYRPGQYASVQAAGTDIPARCYSFAHACTPGGRRDISFFIRAVPNGRMSHWLMNPAALNQKVSLHASLGDFYLRDSRRDLLCIAGGSGLAPLIALLEGALEGAQETGAANRNVFLLMGARSQRDLYYLDAIKALQQKWQGRFEFIPVLSEEPADSDWKGQRGWVTDAITPDIAGNAEGYLCGPPPMIDAAITCMTALGVAREQIYFDKFSDQTIPAQKAG